MKKIYFISFMIFFQIGLYAQSKKVTLEAASPDPTLVPRGSELPIDTYTESSAGDRVFLVSSSNLIDKEITGVLIDENFVVIKKIEASIFDTKNSVKGSFLVAVEANRNSSAEMFLKTQFKIGDVVKLRKDGNVCSLKDVLTINKVQMILGLDKFITAEKSILSVKGSIDNASLSKKYSLSFNDDQKTSVKSKFSLDYKLKEGVNYIEIFLWEDNLKVDEKSLVVFLTKKQIEAKQKILWIEQFPNAKMLTSDMNVAQMLDNAVKAGFTAIVEDVKGPEGYVSYRKNPLSKSPYLTSTINPNKKVKDTGFDLLQSMIEGCRKRNLKIYVSFNFFCEGNITTQDFPILKDHPEWEEIVQRPEDRGQLMKITDSKVGQDAKMGKRIALAFVNPSNPEISVFELSRVKEVLQNYQVDGIVMDRTRYDNLYADFSELTRDAFAKYLEKKGQQLNKFPQDVFTIDSDGKLIEGKYYIDWLTFRSLTVVQFVQKLRNLVDDFNKTSGKKIELASYVGSWYEIYYQNGVNWASSNFMYNKELGFPESRIYSDEYAQTSYTKYLDFLMIGTYYKTEKEIAKYITLGNILTNGELPLIASISLPDLKKENRTPIIKSALKTSSGVMIFDLCYIKWNEFIQQMQSLK